jgi:predicted small metal-binding protein
MQVPIPRRKEGTAMKHFACGDVVPGCDAQFAFPTEEELLHAVAEHARAAHGIEHVPDELVQQVRARIREAA